MEANDGLRRIGITDMSSAGWTAGASYSRQLAQSLSQACQAENIQVYFFSALPFQHDDGTGYQHVQLPPAVPLPGEEWLRRRLRLPAKRCPIRGENRLRRWLRLPSKASLFTMAAHHQVSVLIPVFGIPSEKTTVRAIGWIPDFQHVYLPEFFSLEDRQRRDKEFQQLAERSSLVMLSSQAAFEHFRTFVPRFASKGRVVPFPSRFASMPLPENPEKVIEKYHLPRKFALVSNQFWAHKNHLVVVDALSRLRREGKVVPVVMTGLPNDTRDPSNRNLSELFQAIASAGLWDQVRVLFQVPYSDLIDLIRVASVVIQPSRFEGWSTIVEDAKALGRPLLCSDLAVHREQAPLALGFFSSDNGERLGAILSDCWEHLVPGPQLELESQALTHEREFTYQHGQSLLAICKEAHSST